MPFMMGMHVFRTSTSQFRSFLPVDLDRVMTDEPTRDALECAALGSKMYPSELLWNVALAKPAAHSYGPTRGRMPVQHT